MAPRRIAGAAADLALLLSVLAAAATCAAAAAGRDFYVGGHAGWAPNPAEPFNAWAERNRFQVNDTLVFRYSKGADDAAVLVVTQGHYDACNATEPLLRLDGGGDARFVFRASGPYFFISADAARCRAGERLIVVVLAVRDDDGASSSSPPKPASPPTTSPPPSKPSASSPPVATPAPHAPPTPPPPPPHHVPGKNASSSSPSPAPAPGPGTNGTSSSSSPPPSPSSAAALSGGFFLACLLVSIGGAAVLV